MNNLIRVTILGWFVVSYAHAMSPCDEAILSSPIKSSIGANFRFESAAWRGGHQRFAVSERQRIKLVEQNRMRIETMTIEIPLEQSSTMRSVPLFSNLLENYDLIEFAYVEVQKLNLCSTALQTFSIVNTCLSGVATFMDRQLRPVTSQVGDVLVVSRKNSLIYAIYQTRRDVTEEF